MTLYKYLGPDRVDVLRNREIRFTQAAALNDPFELNTYFDALAQDGQLVEHIIKNPLDLTPHLIEAYEQLGPEAKAQIPLDRSLGFAKTMMESDEGKEMFWETIGTALGFLHDLTPQLRDQFTQACRTRIGILSLSEVPDSVLMWSHYAAQHRGFIVGFDEGHQFFNRRRGPQDEFFHLRRVEYRPAKAFADLTEMDGAQILLAKSPDWSYEQEWRMLMPVDMVTRSIGSADEPIHLVEVPASAVHSVIVGARIADSARRELMAVLSRPEYDDVSVHAARLDNRLAQVIFDPQL